MKIYCERGIDILQKCDRIITWITMTLTTAN